MRHCIRDVRTQTLRLISTCSLTSPPHCTSSYSQQVLSAASHNTRSDGSFLCACGEYLFLLHHVIPCKSVNYDFPFSNKRPFTTRPLFTTQCLDPLSPLHGLVPHSRRMDALHPRNHKCPRLDHVLRNHFLHRNLLSFK